MNVRKLAGLHLSTHAWDDVPCNAIPLKPLRRLLANCPGLQRVHGVRVTEMAAMDTSSISFTEDGKWQDFFVHQLSEGGQSAWQRDPEANRNGKPIIAEKL